MGKVENPEASKAVPLIEVKALAKPLDTNRTTKISLMLGRY
jgi:hypothetical protein